MQSDLRFYKKGKDYHNSDDSQGENFDNEQRSSYEDKNDDDSFEQQYDNKKIKNISKKNNNKRNRGRPRKQLNKEAHKGLDYIQVITQDGQEIGIKERNYNYIRKFPKDPFKLYMIKEETKTIRLFHQLQNIPIINQQQTNNQMDEDIQFISILNKSNIVQDRLDWVQLSQESGYNSSSILYQLNLYINEEIENPSDPLNQEFISLSLENFIVKFFQHKMISREYYLFQDLINDSLINKPVLKFYDIQFEDFFQLVLADISISLYQNQVLQQIVQYLNIVKDLLKFIKPYNQIQNKYPIKLTSIKLDTINSKQIDMYLPFAVYEDDFDLIDDNLVDIVKYFNQFWSCIADFRFKYYGIYLQLSQ